MGERAKIMLNEYTAKALLKRDDLDLDKFYSTDIKMMVKVAQQELKKKDNIINELEKYIHNELVLDFYNDDMPCELIINKMEKMIKELKENK